MDIENVELENKLYELENLKEKILNLKNNE